ncbi:MAG: MotA/TolQ/ExbB proton channel family protein [Pseudomonadota bacterium]
MKLLKLAGLSLCAGVAALSVETTNILPTATAVAQQIGLDDVLNAVRQERRASAEANRQREQRFLAERNTQRAQVAEVKRQKNAAKAETTRLEGVRDTNRERLAELTRELDEKNAEYRELFGAARSAANELKSSIQSSLISSEFPGRDEQLQKTAVNDSLPAIEELEYLWDTYLQEIVQQGKISTYTASVVDSDGKTGVEKTVTRVGPFVAMSDNDFLTYAQNDQGVAQLKLLARQPGGGRTALAGNVENAQPGQYVRGIVDPSLGALLALTVDEPTLNERIKQGGTVGYVIIGIAIFGILLGLYKLVTLTLTNGAVSAQARSKRANKGNPLGRVMQAYEATNTADVETVALRLDDAVLKEIPKLEGGLNFIKVLAAVAPLLGLLGTVIGMIQTFQAITLFGTGDPQIMAGGISAALMTTVQGLIAAIPLLLIHAFASGAAKNVSQTLEQKAAGIIAEHAEGRG